jgi:hypothetical protein
MVVPYGAPTIADSGGFFTIASRISRLRLRRRIFCFRNRPNLDLSPFLADINHLLPETTRVSADRGEPAMAPAESQFMNFVHLGGFVSLRVFFAAHRKQTVFAT